MLDYIVYTLQGLALMALTPLFTGILKKFKAIIRGYAGPPVLQPYYDLAKLFKKGKVKSKYSSFVLDLGPSISLAASVACLLFVPVVYAGKGGYWGNIFMIMFLLAVTKFINSLLGLDCASTFGGMGSSRELFISMLAEPVLFILIAFLYFETKSFNLFSMAFINSSANYNAPHIIAGLAFFILLITENARVPVDNPETHLELTMVHEAMILDVSGSDLAYLELASGFKLMAFITIFVNCFVPYGLATSLIIVPILASALIFIIKVVLCLALIAYLETTKAKFRLFRVPELLAAAFSFSILAVTINFFL